MFEKKKIVRLIAGNFERYRVRRFLRHKALGMIFNGKGSNCDGAFDHSSR
jgi:hypothetical protein